MTLGPRALKSIAGLSCIAMMLACSTRAPAAQLTEWRGVDLSYVNELEQCGAKYRDASGRTDPYAILARAGANVVRLRLWHSPTWTRFSTLDDVKQSIRRARENKMAVLLDFHYSDDWVHPGRQIVPSDWKEAADDDLPQLLYDYTRSTLAELNRDGLLPEYVQVGNETNTDLLIDREVAEDAPIDWSRNVKLLNAGIRAVRQASKDSEKPIGIMLHVAQPENVEPWFDNAAKAGILDFDLIGISYYAKWSKTSFDKVGNTISRLRAKFAKEVVVVETAYPWTLDSKDSAGNLLGEDSLIPGYPATKSGQRRQLIDLTATIFANGGSGIVYWEPAWISSKCRTRWGTGSHWENAALFDFRGRLHAGADFLSAPYSKPQGVVEAKSEVDARADD